jgi:3-oxoacyl-[acyl-carrier protein] reductase
VSRSVNVEENSDVVGHSCRNLYLRGDVKDSEFVNSIQGFLQSQEADLVGVVHCAAIIGEVGSIEDLSNQSWIQDIEVNLTGTFNVLKMATAIFKQQHRGHFVALSGGGAADPRPKMLSYSASKTAVVRLVESVAEDNRAGGLTFNCVAPGVLPTAMNVEALTKGVGILPPEYLEKIAHVFSETETLEDFFTEPVELIVNLVLGKLAGVTGKLISATWDDWRQLPFLTENELNSQLFTLRRITIED